MVAAACATSWTAMANPVISNSIIGCMGGAANPAVPAAHPSNSYDKDSAPASIARSANANPQCSRRIGSAQKPAGRAAGFFSGINLKTTVAMEVGAIIRPNNMLRANECAPTRAAQRFQVERYSQPTAVFRIKGELALGCHQPFILGH